MRKSIFRTNHTYHNCLLESSHLENLSVSMGWLKIHPQVKFLGITFDSKLTFQRHFEEILGRCNTRHHRVRPIANKKRGPSPSTILQIHKQCVRPIFEYGSPSTITTLDTIISKIQRPQNKFIRPALRLPKYISAKPLHDSSGLPYAKDRPPLVQLGHRKGFPRIL